MQFNLRLMSLFMGPIILVLIPLILAGLLAMNQLQNRLGEIEHQQLQDLESLKHVAMFGQQLGHLHERILTTLRAATAGEMSSLALYREHSQLVNELATLGKDLNNIGKLELLARVDKRQVEALLEHYADYQRMMVIATEIAAVDPSTAEVNLINAQDSFTAFAIFNQQIAELLSSQIYARTTDAYNDFNAFSRYLMMFVPLALLLLLAFAYLMSQWLNRHMLIITQGLLELSQDGEKLPMLADVKKLARQNKGPLQQLASGLLNFRSALQQRKHAEEKIFQLAYFDSLTGLSNWQYLAKQLAAAISESQQHQDFSILITMDLDNFKVINDSRGHSAGDTILKEMAERLKNLDLEHYQLARLGGDEFALMLTRVASTQSQARIRAEQLALQISELVARPCVIHHDNFFLSASLGIVIFGADESLNTEMLFRSADAAMNKAKQLGRNTYCFHDPEMLHQLEANAQTSIELREALNQEQIMVFYQLQFDSQGKAIGAEALVRWQHPEKGILSPAFFIEIAEHTGLIIPLGQRVLQLSCEQLSRWQAQPETLELTLSVNVSPKQFQQADFVDYVRRLLADYKILPGRLKLELTESTILGNVLETVQKMHQLRALGVTFSLDDFGTGYSSLQYLKQLPIDQIKIDQSFVRDITHDPDDKAIVKSIIAIGNALQIQVIAEGVETQQHFAVLRDNACFAYQGYYFCRPMPIEDINSVLMSKAV